MTLRDAIIGVIVSFLAVYYYINYILYSEPKLSIKTDDFILMSSCDEKATIIDNSILIPVADYTTECPETIIDAISKKSYKSSSISFDAIFDNKIPSTRFDDEMVVFMASNIINWTEQEFGIISNLSDGILYGYVQNGTESGVTTFKKIPLVLKPDNLKHNYKIKTDGKTFRFYIDNLLKGEVLVDVGINYKNLEYWIILTTHHWNGNWDSKGSYMQVSDVKIG